MKVFCVGNDAKSRYMFSIDDMDKSMYDELKTIARNIGRRLVVDRNQSETLIFPSGTVKKVRRNEMATRNTKRRQSYIHR